MNEISNSKEDEMDKGFNSADIPSHEQVIELIEDIKKFEQKYPLFDVEIPEETHNKDKRNEAIEDPDNLENSDIETAAQDLKENQDKLFQKNKKSFFPNISLNLKFRNKKSNLLNKKKKTKKKSVKPNVFRVGYNENGELVNLDFKNKKPSKPSNVNEGKKTNFLKKIFKFKKSGEDESKSSDAAGKFGKIKNVFGKLGKLKNAIPFKRNK